MIAILTVFFILILSLISIDKAGKTSAQRELKNMSSAIHDYVGGLLEKGEYQKLKLFIKEVSDVSKRKISVPIINLSEASRELSQGNYDIKLYSSDSSELGELTDNFNNMVIRQKSLIESIKAERDQLEAIIGGMNDGVLVFDAKGKVKLANKSFCEIIDHKEVEDKFYWEVLRLESFGSLVEELNQSKNQIKSQINIEESTYSICLNFLKTRSWIVVTFHDITQISRLAKMKRDFVINASHELKTPLTSIKGFVETMKEDAGEEQKRYFEIIKRNSERVINIIQDLLMLS